MAPPLLPNQTGVYFVILAALLFCVTASPQSAFAGTGTYKDGKFNFCVSVRFNATEAQLQRIRQGLGGGDQCSAGSKDGQHQFSGGGIADSRKRQVANDVVVRLDYYAFRDRTDRTDTSVLLRGDGTVRVVRYWRSSSVVVAEYKGSLPKADVARLLAATRTSAFRRAARRKNFSGSGWDGSIFNLTLEPQGIALGGIMPATPKVIRDFVADLRALWKQVGEVSIADAYIRSRLIEEDRLEGLRRQYQISSVSEFPNDVQTILVSAISKPLEFQPLSRAQYDQLRGRNLLVLYKGCGYEHYLFLTKSKATAK